MPGIKDLFRPEIGLAALDQDRIDAVHSEGRFHAKGHHLPGRTADRATHQCAGRGLETPGQGRTVGAEHQIVTT